MSGSRSYSPKPHLPRWRKSLRTQTFSGKHEAGCGKRSPASSALPSPRRKTVLSFPLFFANTQTSPRLLPWSQQKLLPQLLLPPYEKKGYQGKHRPHKNNRQLSHQQKKANRHSLEKGIGETENWRVERASANSICLRARTGGLAS